MSLVIIIEVGVLCVGIYYLYFLFTNYSRIKSSKKLSAKYKNQFFYSLFGALGIIISFQIFWFTNFYENHPYIEVLIKIILGIFSIINQMLITDLEKVKKKDKKKKNDDYYLLKDTSSDKNTGFKLINRLYLLNIIFKLIYRKTSKY